MPPAPRTVMASMRHTPRRRRRLFPGVFLEVALELLAMLLYSGHEPDRQVLGDVVFAVRLLDDEAVLGDGFFLGLEDAADHVHDIGRVGGRLQAFLAHFQRETARNGAAELLDAVTQPLGV